VSTGSPENRIRHPLPEPGWPSLEAAARARLFSPVRVGPVTLGSRTWVPAMVPWRATLEGEVTPALIAWYARFAAGRPGALVVEATGIRDVPSGPLLRIGHDRYLPGLTRLVEAVREASGGETKLFIQLIDFLAVKRRPEPAVYFSRFLRIDQGHRVRLAALTGDPSWSTADEVDLRGALLGLSREQQAEVLTAREQEALDYGHRERVTDLELPHVRSLPEVLPGLFAAAAQRAEAAGFDGVELHYAHAYTMASFLSRTNDRSDGYGGSPEGRLRLPLEVYRAVRNVVRPETVVGARFLADEVILGGSRVEDAAYYAVELARAGLDFLSLSKGGKFDDAKQPRVGHSVYPYTGPSGHECMPTVWSDSVGPFGRQLPLVRQIRRAVLAAGLVVPVVAAGGLNTFRLAEDALLRGDADIIAAARQSLADPDWWQKMREGRGDEIRRCAVTNYCEGLDQHHKEVTCRLWDRQDLESPLVTLRSADGKRRLVAPGPMG
jgi:2,4-dienoyl-CoA reductase-like NADH-dependent reductase (Old Yellow Enzyme family)